MDYITNAIGLNHQKGSIFTFVACPIEVQFWLETFNTNHHIYKIDVENDASRTLTILEFNQFAKVATKSKDITYWIVPKEFKRQFPLLKNYEVIYDFENVLRCNGFVLIKYFSMNGILRTSTISCTFEVVDEKGDRYEVIGAKTRYDKLKRIIRKDLVYHTYLAPMFTPIPLKYIEKPKINPDVTATKGAIAAHQEGCNWLPGPKKEVKPRARKKKT